VGYSILGKKHPRNAPLCNARGLSHTRIPLTENGRSDSVTLRYGSRQTSPIQYQKQKTFLKKIKIIIKNY
jgi:hypothetical protein